LRSLFFLFLFFCRYSYRCSSSPTCDALLGLFRVRIEVKFATTRTLVQSSCLRLARTTHNSPVRLLHHYLGSFLSSVVFPASQAVRPRVLHPPHYRSRSSPMKSQPQPKPRSIAFLATAVAVSHMCQAAHHHSPLVDVPSSAVPPSTAAASVSATVIAIPPAVW
jgi:hypothetical protein